MIAEDEPGIRPTKIAATEGYASLHPPGAELQQVAFVTEAKPGQQVLLVLPQPLQCRAVLVGREAGEAPSDLAASLWLLKIPTATAEATSAEHKEHLAFARTWVEAAAPHEDAPALMMTFQGAQIVWAPGRVAVLAPAERLTALSKALIEASYYEAELREIESAIGAAWPQFQADSPLAFEFNERSIGERKRLRQRFQEVLLFHARLARLSPHIDAPHLHPPTLASQVGERLRERTRMVHRLEYLIEQIEVFEQVYEMCGQRSSDFMLARTGHILEGIIILLLIAQLTLSAFEILTSLGQ